MKRFFIGFTSMLFIFGCQKSDSVVSNTATKSTLTNNTSTIDTISTISVIDASATQQTIYGFGGADIIDWTGDLTSAQ
ncbi:MAG TPA: hypothetical protein VFQ86_01220 [Arachidicoccus soli]|nr:hypothetical protein [Arachidicoccus soli]